MTSFDQTSSRIAIVTGSASGIGRSIAMELATQGFDIAVIDIQDTAAAESARHISKSLGVSSSYATADVTDYSACTDAYQRIVNTLGKPSVLINNAGIVVRRKARLEDLPDGHFEEMMAIHVKGTLNWSRLVLPSMRAAGYGRIVNVSSVNAIAAVPYRIGYVTAKKAIQGVTEALALETARAGITVNAIAPGYILTDVLRKRADAGILDQQAIVERTPVGRWGTPEDIAKVVAFLASRDAGFMTGTTVVVDGGYSIRGDAGEDLNNAPVHQPHF